MSDISEEVVDVAEAVAEEVVDIVWGNPYILGGVALGSLAIGAAASFLLTRKRLTRKFDDQITEEIELARQHYKKWYSQKLQEHVDELAEGEIEAEKLVREASQAMTRYQGDDTRLFEEEEKNDDEIVEVSENIFVRRDAFDYQAALAEREANPDEPYVISHVEYMENEPDHAQTTFTYFAEDDILCDEHDEPVDASHTIGEGAFAKFGHGSQDNNVVYVRNEHVEMDYEVVKSEGSYTKEVLGVSDKPRSSGSRKFRVGDDE